MHRKPCLIPIIANSADPNKTSSLEEQSDLGLHCLFENLGKITDFKLEDFCTLKVIYEGMYSVRS